MELSPVERLGVRLGFAALWVAVFGTLGAGVMIVAPNTWVGWGLIAVAFVTGAGLTHYHLTDWLNLKWKDHRPKVLAVAGMTACATGLGLFLVLYVSQTKITSSSIHKTVSFIPGTPPSFRTVFEHDYLGQASLIRELEIHRNIDGSKFCVPVKMSWNTDAGVKIFSLLLPANSNEAVGVSNYVLANIDAVVKLLSIVNAKVHLADNAGIALTSSFPLSKTIYFYMSEDLGLQDRAEIDRAYSAAGYTVRLYGFFYYRSKIMDRDFFRSLENTTHDTMLPSSIAAPPIKILKAP